jgi:hypothetical protein
VREFYQANRLEHEKRWARLGSDPIMHTGDIALFAEGIRRELGDLRARLWRLTCRAAGHNQYLTRSQPPATSAMHAPVSHADFLQLKRWNTPTIYNGWEQITRHDISRVGFNREETRDFMPQMGPMVGRAVTVVCEPSNAEHPRRNPNAWSEYRRYVASVPGPKIVGGGRTWTSRSRLARFGAK